MVQRVVSRFFDEGVTVPQVAAISDHRTVSMLFRYAHAQQHDEQKVYPASGHEKTLVTEVNKGAD